MAITYPLTLPSSVGPRAQTWMLSSAIGILESPFTFQQQVQAHAGERWIVDIAFPIMTSEDAGAFRAFFAMLRGSFGTFLYGDVTRAAPLGAISGSPLVKGANQTGNELLIDAAGTSITNVFKAGDWIQLGSGSTSRLHMVVADASSNGSGEATLTIVPALRESPADNAAVTYTAPKGVFRAAKNDMQVFATSGPKHSSFKLTAAEVV